MPRNKTGQSQGYFDVGDELIDVMGEGAGTNGARVPKRSVPSGITADDGVSGSGGRVSAGRKDIPTGHGRNKGSGSSSSTNNVVFTKNNTGTGVGNAVAGATSRINVNTKNMFPDKSPGNTGKSGKEGSSSKGSSSGKSSGSGVGSNPFSNPLAGSSSHGANHGYAGGWNGLADDTNPGGVFNGDIAALAERDRFSNYVGKELGTNEYKKKANMEILKHAVDDLSLLSDIGLLPFDDLMASIKNKNINGYGDIKEVEFKDHGVDLEGVTGIIGLPYMADNVVDPPPMWNASELSGELNSWESGRCGKDFTKRVLERGQYLVLMPIELRPNITDTVALGLAGATGSITSNIVSGLITKVDSVEQRLNVTSYGFTAKIAAKRYWRSVQAHAKAILYALGIDEFGGDFWKRDNTDKKNFLKMYMPDYLVDNVYATTDMEMTLNNLADSKSAEAGELEEYEEATKKADISAEENTNAIGSKFQVFGKDGKREAADAALKSEVGKVGSGFITNALGKFIGYDDDTNSLDSTGPDVVENGAPVTSMYTGSMMAKLIHYIMNIDMEDKRIQTMPYTVFYCNGPIDRTYSWSIETGPSKLGEHAILGTKRAVKKGMGKLFNNIMSSVTGGAGEGSTQAEAEAGKEGVAMINEAMDPMQDMMNEWAYHNSGKTMGSFLINNLYVPKVQNGGSSQFAYTVPIRDMALSSDRYSLARLHFTMALLIPYVYQTTYPRQALIIPSSALYCSAFSKGVINCPRAVISSMSVKTDNAFQTTFGVPTELDITLTIEPLYTMGITPDFNKYWAVQNHPYYFLGAMWNPMSSINMLATMCGQNTVFSRMPVGLFEFFIKGNIGKFYDSIRGGYASFRASIRDYFSSLGMSQNNYKMI